MALIRTGNGIIEIRGSTGGVYFHRDKYGLHISSKPRNIQQCTSDQKKQRGAFTTARAFSKVNRTVSYNIYRALNDLSPAEPPLDYQIPHLQEPPE